MCLDVTDCRWLRMLVFEPVWIDAGLRANASCGIPSPEISAGYALIKLDAIQVRDCSVVTLGAPCGSRHQETADVHLAAFWTRHCVSAEVKVKNTSPSAELVWVEQ